MKPTRGVGLIGAGRVSELHAAALRRLDIPLIGVVASTPERSARAAARLRADRAFSDTDALLADPRIDTIHITTPSGQHAEQVERALLAGKHVVCEKPLSTTVSQSQRLAQLAVDRGLVGTVAYTYRFHRVVRALRGCTPSLGALTLIRGSYLQEWLLSAGPSEWRLDPAQNGPSRALADVGSHAIDLIEFVTGDRIASVSSAVREVVKTSGHGAHAGDDVAVVAFELASGALGSLDVSQVAVGHANSLTLELNGTEGSAGFDLGDPTQIWHARRDGRSPSIPVSADARESGRPGESDPAPDGPDYLGAYESFLAATHRAIDGEPTAGLPTFHDCARASLVRATILRSSSQRAWVDIPIGEPDIGSSAVTARLVAERAGRNPASRTGTRAVGPVTSAG